MLSQVVHIEIDLSRLSLVYTVGISQAIVLPELTRQG